MPGPVAKRWLSMAGSMGFRMACCGTLACVSRARRSCLLATRSREQRAIPRPGRAPPASRERRPAWPRAMLRARLHPGLRPGETGARALPVAPHLRPHAARRDLPVDLELGRPRGEEGAEHADGPIVEAGRRVEHEGVDAVVPRHGDARVG